MTEYELNILKALSQKQCTLPSGAAVNQAIECLRGSGYIGQYPSVGLTVKGWAHVRNNP